MRPLLLLVLAATAMLAGTSSATAEAIDAGAPYCEDLAPEAVPVPMGGEPIDVHVLVLLDGISPERGQAIFAAADRPYGMIGMRLVPEFRSVSLRGRLVHDLMAQARGLVGGARPPSAHLVYVLTAKDVAATTASGDDDGVAGSVACIGGIAFADMAFAVGEDTPSVNNDHGQKIAGHEIGHLFGGQHHYDNCAEGLADEGPFPLEPCGLMASAPTGLLTLKFGSVSAAIVRGYAEEFVAPLAAAAAPAPPPAEPAPPAQPAPAPDQASTPPATAGVSLTVGAARRDRRGLRVRLRSSGPLRGISARLLRRGRTVARARLAHLNGRATLRLRARRRLRPGRYVLLVRAGDVGARRTITLR